MAFYLFGSRQTNDKIIFCQSSCCAVDGVLFGVTTAIYSNLKSVGKLPAGGQYTEGDTHTPR